MQLKGRKNVTELINEPERVYPVGRLDFDTTGLLIMTNDGDFANNLMHPKHQVNKVYRVQVVGYTHEGFEKLKQPVTLDGYRIQPPKVQLIRWEGDKALYHVTIGEGRNRQVRRMCAAAGMEVKRLVRVAEGSLTLGDLPLGKWRHLTKEEVEELKA